MSYFLQGIVAKRCCKGTLFLEFHNLKSKKMMKKSIQVIAELFLLPE